MIQLKNRAVDEYGIVHFQVEDLYEYIMQGYDIKKFPVVPSPLLDGFTETCRTLYSDDLMLEAYALPTESLEARMSNYRGLWHLPDQYKNINPKDYVLERCTTDEQRQRVYSEFVLYERYDLLNMLRSLIYLVDVLTRYKVVWGVGRGSSVSSYVLYLIGIHQIDSLEYDLSFSEFLN